MKKTQVQSEVSKREEARKIAEQQTSAAQPSPAPETPEASTSENVLNAQTSATEQLAEVVAAAPIPECTEVAEHPQVEEIAGQSYPIALLDLDKIVNSSFNPRKSFSEASLQELADSIRQVGVLQPICVRPKDDAFEIVYGERRYWAAVMANQERIPAFVRELSDAEAEDAAITENLQREDVKPMEEAAAYRKALDSGRHTVESLVGKFGKSEAYIRSRLKLCGLIDELSELLDGEEISVGVAMEIAKYDSDIQREVYADHFSEHCRSSWKNARIKEVARQLYQRYMTQLDTYRFDKAECRTCMNNTANQVLFADCTDGCAGCQNMDCMIRKNEAFLKQKAVDLLHNDPRIVLAADDDAPQAVIDALIEEGYQVESLEYAPSYYESGPQQPVQPAPENYEDVEEYNAAMMYYQDALEAFEEESRALEFDISEGRMLKYAVIGAFDVKILYDEAMPEVDDGTGRSDSAGRTVFTTRVPESPREGLLRQDHRNRQLCYEHITEDLKKMLREAKVSNRPLTKPETQLFHYAVMRALGDAEMRQCGIKSAAKYRVTPEERFVAASRPTEKQKAAIMRQFILTSLCRMAQDCNCTDELLDTRLLCEFAELNFAEQSRPIMEKHREVYDKRKSRLDERIEALDALELETEKRISLEMVPDFEPDALPELSEAPDAEPAVAPEEPVTIPAEPEIGYDPSLRPQDAELAVAA